MRTVRQRIVVIPQQTFNFTVTTRMTKRCCMSVEEVVGALMMEEDQDNLEEPMMESSDDDFDLEEEKTFLMRKLILALSWITQALFRATCHLFQC